MILTGERNRALVSRETLYVYYRIPLAFPGHLSSSRDDARSKILLEINLENPASRIDSSKRVKLLAFLPLFVRFYRRHTCVSGARVDKRTNEMEKRRNRESLFRTFHLQNKNSQSGSLAAFYRLCPPCRSTRIASVIVASSR